MRRLINLGLAAALPLSLAVAATVLPQPMFLINASPSVAPGLYVRTGDAPAVGRLLAFHTPRPGRAYAREHLPELERGSILKPIVGSVGSWVCSEHGRLELDGRVLGPVAAWDRQGAPLPRWSGCRRLSNAEYLVFSSRIPNSFDSRYYGPVPASDVIGVYRLAWAPRGPDNTP